MKWMTDYIKNDGKVSIDMYERYTLHVPGREFASVCCSLQGEDSEEAETFFSTRSFSSDSSEFYSRRSSKTRKIAQKKTEQINTKKKLQEKSISSSHPRHPRRRAARSRDDFGKGFQPLVSVSFSEEDERLSSPRVARWRGRPDLLQRRGSWWSAWRHHSDVGRSRGPSPTLIDWERMVLQRFLTLFRRSSRQALLTEKLTAGSDVIVGVAPAGGSAGPSLDIRQIA
ncbi:hypothetical protein KSP40_PGU000132 [Platanthera guangdongensis]|uniref:Uncharacterized protein n=1 Tax=Platanthera guangdongensis TaxID=2320717 RepID=A0ABR2MDL7_9ASPA